MIIKPGFYQTERKNKLISFTRGTKNLEGEAIRSWRDRHISQASQAGHLHLDLRNLGAKKLKISLKRNPVHKNGRYFNFIHIIKRKYAQLRYFAYILAETYYINFNIPLREGETQRSNAMPTKQSLL